MKRIRVPRLAGQLLVSASAARPANAAVLSSCSTLPASPATASIPLRLSPQCRAASRRYQSTVPERDITGEASPSPLEVPTFTSSATSSSSSTSLSPGLGPSLDPRFPDLFPEAVESPAYPSPLPERAHQSAKLAALHARLGLSQRLPLETLARTLVDASADPTPRFNNTSLAYLGSTLINYHVSEWLMCRYPRLPMVILYAALKGYAGPQALAEVARQWGVDAAAAPGAEVDPGLLQYSLQANRQQIRQWGYERAEAKYKFKWRHGISSRVVLDDDFGDIVGDRQPSADGGATADASAEEPGSVASLGGSLDADTKTKIANDAHANFVRAVAGAVYAHGGREAVRSFVRAHVLSRQLDLERLFRFRLPTRELAYLCARENFEPPVARLESETGRKSRTPVFVVGIYSGGDKLGEGTAASLDHARNKAAMNCLKAWYLYSPGENVRVPSDMLQDDAEPWQPAYVDIGEIL